MIELILFSLLGIGIGIVTGLIPGMHVNNLIPILLTSSFFISDPLSLSVMIISIAVTQTFIQFIPSIFLGAPEEGTSLSVLPGHKLLFEGRGYEAVKLTVIGGIGSLLLTMFLVTIFSQYFQTFYTLSRPYIQYLLLFIIAAMIVSEKSSRKILYASSIILMSGILGILILNFQIVNQRFVLFPAFSGLFGLSTLISSVGQNSKIPEQSEKEKMEVSKYQIIKSIFFGSIAGITVGFLPAVGVSQAATFFQTVGGANEPRSFLLTLSGINVSNEFFSLISLFLIGNPRSGASVAIQSILGDIGPSEIMILISTIIFSTGAAAILTLKLGKIIPSYLIKIDYKLLSFLVIIFILSLITIFTGIFGLLICFTSTSLGLLSYHLGIKRSNCMGILLIPSILFFSGIYF